MASIFDNVFILGATSGLGAALARRFYKDGKRVMIAGRRQERLEALEKEMPGAQSIQIDVEDIQALPGKLSEVTTRFPEVDQIILMAGQMNQFDFKDPSTSADASIVSEITSNLTFPVVAARHLVSWLLERSKPTKLVLVSSGLGFLPHNLYPVYCPTKAAVHAFACTLRGQLAGTSITVTELVPPYVDTDLDSKFRERVQEITGGRAPKPMPLNDFINQAYAELTDTTDGKPKGEVAIGFAKVRADAWWGATKPIFEQIGLSSQIP
ncbi:MAG: hypothetical protein M1820_000996 [Bogoriella megaspora]|nr:MAG: hypothetical protein M1820_000996 [Bogoriella megaspora]